MLHCSPGFAGTKVCCTKLIKDIDSNGKFFSLWIPKCLMSASLFQSLYLSFQQSGILRPGAVKKFSGRDALLRVHNRKRKADAEHRAPTRSDPLELLKRKSFLPVKILITAGTLTGRNWSRATVHLLRESAFTGIGSLLAFPCVDAGALLGQSKLGKRTSIPIP